MTSNEEVTQLDVPTEKLSILGGYYAAIFRHVNSEELYKHYILGGFFLSERGILARKNPTEDPN